MKREALNHPKMHDLAARLDISQAQAIGHVTLLINWTADFAIQGDVGKWPNGAIARGCGWGASPDTFVDALRDAGWLDEHSTYRLVLHDWPDHAERWVKSKLSSLGLKFLDAYNAPSPDTSEDTSEDTSADPPRDHHHHQSEPVRTEPHHHHHQAENGGGGGELPATKEQLVRLLRAKPYGLVDAKTACADALEAGCTVQEIRAVAAHWLDSRAWNQKQLHYRISCAQPGESPAEHWPPKKDNGRRGTGDPETDRANQEYLQRRERTRRANGTQTQTPESLAAS